MSDDDLTPRCWWTHLVYGRCTLAANHPVGPMYPGDDGHIYVDGPPMTYTPPEPNAALVVGPDDVLVLAFPAMDLVSRRILVRHIESDWPQMKGRVLLAFAAELAVVRDVPQHPPDSLAVEPPPVRSG